jgi:hypothetical protein
MSAWNLPDKRNMLSERMIAELTEMAARLGQIRKRGSSFYRAQDTWRAAHSLMQAQIEADRAMRCAAASWRNAAGAEHVARC